MLFNSIHILQLSALLQALQAEDKESAVQCMVLKMLTDFTLMYNACVGVILKRDAEGLGAKGGSPPVTPSVKSGKSVSWAKSVLFRYVNIIFRPGGHGLQLSPHLLTGSPACLDADRRRKTYACSGQSVCIPSHLTCHGVSLLATCGLAAWSKELPRLEQLRHCPSALTTLASDSASSIRLHASNVGDGHCVNA